MRCLYRVVMVIVTRMVLRDCIFAVLITDDVNLVIGVLRLIVMNAA